MDHLVSDHSLSPLLLHLSPSSLPISPLPSYLSLVLVRPFRLNLSLSPLPPSSDTFPLISPLSILTPPSEQPLPPFPSPKLTDERAPSPAHEPKLLSFLFRGIHCLFDPSAPLPINEAPLSLCIALHRMR